MIVPESLNADDLDVSAGCRDQRRDVFGVWRQSHGPLPAGRAVADAQLVEQEGVPVRCFVDGLVE